MVADPRQRRPGVGQGQQVVVKRRLVRRPGEVFRDQGGLITLYEMTEARQMRLVERLLAANRHADAMERNGMVAAHRLERAMRRPTRAHVILGMDLEEAARLWLRKDRCEMLMLEARAGESAGRK